MNDFEKELEKELEKAMQETLPPPDLSKLNQFDEILEKNKKYKVKVKIFNRVAIACALVLMITLSCLIPVWMKKDPEVIKYYGDTNTIQVDLTQEFVQNYISENIPNYNFIFEDCNVSNIFGIYDEETNSKLLAISFYANKNDTPVTLSINIVLNKNYTYSEHANFTKNAIKEESENINVYTTETDDSMDYSLYVLLERTTYNTYLVLNINDTEILNKFKQN